MEKSNLPLPLKRKTQQDANPNNGDCLKLEKRKAQFRHSFRDTPGRLGTSRERSQVGGSYFKKRFGYNSKKSSAHFPFKGSKAVVNTLCAAGDLADTCLPVSIISTDETAKGNQDFPRKSGALSMKTKLLQLQERNQMIMARNHLSKNRQKVEVPSLAPLLPLSLEIDKAYAAEGKICDDQKRIGDFCNTSPVYHELDPIEGYSSPEQHTYQSISEVKEEVARLKAQSGFWKTTFPTGSSIKVPEFKAVNTVEKTADNDLSPEHEPLLESETKSSRSKSKSIFSKFWQSRRTCITNTGTPAPCSTSSNSDSATTPTVEDTTCRQESEKTTNPEPVLLSFYHLSSPQKQSEDKMIGKAEIIGKNTDNPLFISTASSINKIPVSCGILKDTESQCKPISSMKHFYLWKCHNDAEIQDKFRSLFEKQEPTLQSFAKCSNFKSNTKLKAQSLDERDTEVGDIKKSKQIGPTSANCAMVMLTNFETPETACSTTKKGTNTAIQQGKLIMPHIYLSEQVTTLEGKLETVSLSEIPNLLLPGEYFSSINTVLLGSGSLPSNSGTGRKTSHTHFSSPSCGIRMAKMRAVQRKSENAPHGPYSSVNSTLYSLLPGNIKSFASQNEQEEISKPASRVCSSSTLAYTTDLRQNIHTIQEDYPWETCYQFLSPPYSEGQQCSSNLKTIFNDAHAEVVQCISDGLKTPVTYSLEEQKFPGQFAASISNYDHQNKSGNSEDFILQARQSHGGKTNGSKLKQPKLIKQSTSSTQVRPSNKLPNADDSDVKLVLSPTEQNTYLSKDKKQEHANSCPLTSQASNKILDAEAPPHVKHAVVRPIETAVSDAGFAFLKEPRSQRCNLVMSRPKLGSCIPRTMFAAPQRTWSADEKPSKTRSLHQNDPPKKSEGSNSRKKSMINTSREEEIRQQMFRRSYSETGLLNDNHSEQLQSTLLSGISKLSLSNKPPNVVEQHTPPDVTRSDSQWTEDISKTNSNNLSDPGYYQASTTSSLSSSLTSSGSSGSVFDIADSESESLSSSQARDSETSSADTQPRSSSIKPISHSAAKGVIYSSGKKSVRGKSQLLAPRMDANRCLERIEKLRIEAKQTKQQFHQKLQR